MNVSFISSEKFKKYLHSIRILDEMLRRSRSTDFVSHFVVVPYGPQNKINE